MNETIIPVAETPEGRWRAEFADATVERASLDELIEHFRARMAVNEVRTTVSVALTFTPSVASSTETDEALARQAVEKTALRNEDLDRLIRLYPISENVGSEPAWTDET